MLPPFSYHQFRDLDLERLAQPQQHVERRVGALPGFQLGDVGIAHADSRGQFPLTDAHIRTPLLDQA